MPYPFAMTDDRKQQLSQIDADTLADALLQLAEQHETADELVNRLLATPEDNLRHAKSKIAGLKRSKRFVRWGESAALARKLEGVLSDIKAATDDPETGAALVIKFLETDEAVIGRCDDSSGHVGDVYRFFARELFVEYAKRCEDKPKLAKQVTRLNQQDDYGLRFWLIDCAADHLPENVIRDMIDSLEHTAAKEPHERNQIHWQVQIESLARQINDAEIFERIRMRGKDTPTRADSIEIARIHLANGDARAALAWMERDPDRHSTFKQDERDQLLLQIHGELGQKDAQEETAWRIFRRYRSEKSLEKLLAVIGENRRTKVIEGELAIIVGKETLSLADAAFLVEVGKVEEAENYLIKRRDQINGDFYDGVLSLAERMESVDSPLATTLLYRALLDSILRRAQTRTYGHGVRYLKKLENLATKVKDWKDIEDHGDFESRIQSDHSRKTSFWKRYNK